MKVLVQSLEEVCTSNMTSWCNPNARNFCEGAQPAWFAPVQQQLHRMEASILKVCFFHFEGLQFLAYLYPAKTANAGNGDGLVHPYEIVPSTNGDDSTAAPVSTFPSHFKCQC